MIDAVSWEFFGPSSSQDKVTLQTCIDDLDDNVLVGETDDEAVLGRIARIA